MRVLPIKMLESQNEFFGKKGLRLHGTMVIWCDSTEGKFKSKMFLQSLNTSTDEDGIAAGGAMVAALQEFIGMGLTSDKIESFRAKMDGASCYTSLNLTRSFIGFEERTGVKWEEHSTGEAGNGKTEVDGVFGGVLSRLTDVVVQGRGTMNVLCQKSLARALSARPVGNSVVQLITTPSKSQFSVFPPELFHNNEKGDPTASKISFTSCSHKVAVRDADGHLIAVRVTQQYKLGEGLLISIDKLLDGKRVPKPTIETIEQPSQEFLQYENVYSNTPITRPTTFNNNNSTSSNQLDPSTTISTSTAVSTRVSSKKASSNSRRTATGAGKVNSNSSLGQQSYGVFCTHNERILKVSARARKYRQQTENAEKKRDAAIKASKERRSQG